MWLLFSSFFIYCHCSILSTESRLFIIFLLHFFFVLFTATPPALRSPLPLPARCCPLVVAPQALAQAIKEAKEQHPDMSVTRVVVHKETELTEEEDWLKPGNHNVSSNIIRADVKSAIFGFYRKRKEMNLYFWMTILTGGCVSNSSVGGRGGAAIAGWLQWSICFCRAEVPTVTVLSWLNWPPLPNDRLKKRRERRVLLRFSTLCPVGPFYTSVVHLKSLTL